MRAQITVKGDKHTWSLDIDPAMVSPEALEDWRADGLEVHEVIHSETVTDEHVAQVQAWTREGVEQ